MSLNKNIRLELAQESLAMAQKMMARFSAGNIPVSELSRVQDAATQATQAAAQLNQLAGMLIAEMDR